MKCDNCKYLYYPEYESNYTACSVFGEDTPEKYERKDGEGCICNRKQLEKIKHKNEEAIAKEHKAFVEWFLKKESENRYDKTEKI